MDIFRQVLYYKTEDVGKQFTYANLSRTMPTRMFYWLSCLFLLRIFFIQSYIFEQWHKPQFFDNLVANYIVAESAYLLVARLIIGWEIFILWRNQMVMRICPNCLISVSYQKNTCHQCGIKIDKRPQSSQKILPRIKSSKPILMQKFKLKRSRKLKFVDWLSKIFKWACCVRFFLTKVYTVAKKL